MTLSEKKRREIFEDMKKMDAYIARQDKHPDAIYKNTFFPRTPRKYLKLSEVIKALKMGFYQLEDLPEDLEADVRKEIRRQEAEF